MTFRFVILSLLIAFMAVSCQKPTSLKISSSGTKSVFKERTKTNELASLTTLAVGLEAPTWELTKEMAAQTSGAFKMDDTYTKIKTSEKVIAITFDDGPHPTNTPRLLDMLKERNIPATFYVVGNMVRNRPQILRRMIAEGHEIGNHTVTHGTLSRMTDSGVRDELTRAHKMILAATGVAPRTMRPPGGAIKKAQKVMILKEYGYPTILWSCDPKDWQRPGVEVVTQRLIDGAYPGGILLVHDLHKATVDAMPRTLDTLLSQGYRFVTITELISMDETYMDN